MNILNANKYAQMVWQIEQYKRSIYLIEIIDMTNKAVLRLHAELVSLQASVDTITYNQYTEVIYDNTEYQQYVVFYIADNKERYTIVKSEEQDNTDFLV